jgi:hypothetical protein
MRRITTILASALLAAACTASPTTSATPSPPSTTAAQQAPGSPMPGGCGTSPLVLGGLPPWTASAGAPGGVSVASHEGNLVGVVFGYPLVAPPRKNGPSNKILWISKEPRNGSELVLTLTPARGSPVTVRQPADSSPGEIYPSIVDVPTAGCWNVVAEWAGHRATLELLYQRP